MGATGSIPMTSEGVKRSIVVRTKCGVVNFDKMVREKIAENSSKRFLVSLKPLITDLDNSNDY